MPARTGIVWAASAVLLCSLSPTTAMAGGSVQGSGVIRIAHGAVDGANVFVHVAVNAYRDRKGHPQGRITWEGPNPNSLPGGNPGPGGPADPYILEVTDITVDGDTAVVTGVVTASPKGHANGETYTFIFTDNSGTGLPDELEIDYLIDHVPFGPVPIDAGNYTVSD